MESLSERVGNGIRKARHSRLLTQRELAARVGFTSQGLWKVESGRGDTPLSTLERIAEALDVDPVTFFSVDPSEQRATEFLLTDLLTPFLQIDGRQSRLVIEGVLHTFAAESSPVRSGNGEPLR